MVLVIEVKTELRDLGAIERTLGWMSARPGRRRRLGWRPRRVLACLLCLSTEEIEDTIHANREALAREFPLRARPVAAIVADGLHDGQRGTRGLALIDPRSRRVAWLRPSRADGRRSPAPYRDYADFIRTTAVADRAH